MDALIDPFINFTVSANNQFLSVISTSPGNRVDGHVLITHAHEKQIILNA
jgi:hypothetical protein